MMLTNPSFVQDDGDQDSDGALESLDATGFAAPLGDTFYNQSQSFSSMQGPPSQDQVFQEPLVLTGDNLVAQPRKVSGMLVSLVIAGCGVLHGYQYLL